MVKHVKEIMETNIVSVPEYASIHLAIDMMVEHNISGVPVVDDNGELRGLVTEYDVLELFEKRAFDNRGNQPCANFMTIAVKSVQADAEIQAAVAIFRSARVRRLLVLDGSKLVGILARRDIVRCVRERQEKDSGANIAECIFSV